MTLTETLAACGISPTLADVPDRVVAYARRQLLSRLAGPRASLDHPLRRKIAPHLVGPSHGLPRRAASLLLALWPGRGASRVGGRPRRGASRTGVLRVLGGEPPGDLRDVIVDLESGLVG